MHELLGGWRREAATHKMCRRRNRRLEMEMEERMKKKLLSRGKEGRRNFL
jgi:hypothetical protein